ncbi:MAG: hypothetical protein HKN23_16420 [Verrucomicrobiales bacterium]|nr:hypothetical protein [Verrucomicrobiales bacterium]
MNLQEEIQREHSRKQSIHIAEWIGDRQEQFHQLMEFVVGESEEEARRAAWAMNYAAEARPHLIEPHIESLIEILTRLECHPGLRRNTVRLLQFVPLPDDLLARIFDVCFLLLNDPNETVAVQACSMTVLSRICQKHPQLAGEVALAIEQQMPHGTAAFRSRGQRTLRELDRL